MDRNEIEQFLYREAHLLDEHRYEEWLSLWTDDAIYWVPCGAEVEDPQRTVSIIYDDRSKLGDRVTHLREGSTSAQARPELRRVVSNIMIAEEEVASNFVLVEARGDAQHVWCGRSLHRLRREGGAIKMQFKKVLLVGRARPMPILQFLP
jgi:3-phenylpropionate/cinnamic acid dioxygenase small subunit